MNRDHHEGFAGLPEHLQPTSGSFREHESFASGGYLMVFNPVDDPMSQGVISLLRGLAREERRDFLNCVERRALLNDRCHLFVIRVDRLDPARVEGQIATRIGRHVETDAMEHES